ncbi:dipeptidase [Pseudoclavibacter sp. CFCC 13796]|uniref:dipeptidase n=1 Tax=Pseudoclavibacter sp. CFCC 13796 TaxID=2615179 RepID=UPI001CE40E69|nr:dipeptidase [Pseudoclavibacter sp. CFCC 13796]
MSSQSLTDSASAAFPAAAELPLVFDGHNDLAWACREHHNYRVDGVGTGLPDLHTDLPRLRAGRVGGQFWSVWVDDEALHGAEQVTATLEQIDFVHRLAAQYPDDLQLARTAAEAREAMQRGRIASLIGIEGGDQIDESLGVLRSYARLGARYMTLTWAQTIPWADSSTDEPRSHGLSEFGRDVVAEMNRIGMLVDLAHVSDATMSDALNASTLPVLVSHSGARALCDHPRNVPDELIRRIGASGGVHMVAFVPSFVSQARRDWVIGSEQGEPPMVTVADVADHIEHVRDLAGIDAVGIGADYDGTGSMPSGLDDVSGYPRLLAELADRGWSHADLDKVAHENVLRVLEASDANHLAFLAGEG